MVLYILMQVTGCTSTLQEAGASPQPIAEAGLTIHALSRVDVRGTATAVATLLRGVQALPPAQRAEAADALQFLAANCPYTRAALLLPLALHDTLQPIPAEHLDPLVQHDWAYLQRGLETHVALLEALGVDLADPAPGDHLFGRLPAGADPLDAAAAVVAAIPDIARDVDGPTMALIDHHSERVEAITGIQRPCPRDPWSILPGQPWTLGMQLAGWHDALRRLHPFANDESLSNTIGEASSLLASHGEAAFIRGDHTTR